MTHIRPIYGNLEALGAFLQMIEVKTDEVKLYGYNQTQTCRQGVPHEPHDIDGNHYCLGNPGVRDQKVLFIAVSKQVPSWLTESVTAIWFSLPRAILSQKFDLLRQAGAGSGPGYVG